MHLDVPYVPTPVEVVEVMLRLAEVGRDDVVYDLGCGDGRIVIAAVEEFGAEHGVCVDLDPERIREAVDNARAAGVEDRITFVEGDLFEVDLTTADVVTLYLLSSVNLELRPKLLRELPPGARVVSHDFSMGDWQPEETVEVGKHSVFFWRIPDPR
ncbi:MAG TPA: class I SAM-dependent methyltransferase [Thermoanaerobaculia bacterium]|nr:class I SAM-dependent methyltransferase [Thermoanaerobaculia bacterium]